MLGRFERLLEQAVEGSVRRVFPTQLQPVQIAKAATRAMEQAAVIGPYGSEVPNLYTVALSQADLQRFADYRGTLTRELAQYLVDYATDRGLQPVAAPRVILEESLNSPVGVVRVDARFVDLEPRRQTELNDNLEATRRLRLADTSGQAAGAPAPTLALVDQSGLRYYLDTASGLVRIGRALDNDVTLPNRRVSRYHAQARWERRQWQLYDLDSTNGTWVDGMPIHGGPASLRAGASVRLGDQDLTCQEEPGGSPW